MNLKYGEMLSFRGFSHAPTREAGVVCLFGAVAADLGFVIEGFGHTYPDCYAKRRVLEPGGEMRWDPCRIEFEFRSKNFFAHKHDPDGTDLVVCWAHDWEKPAVEVLELRLVVEGLRALEKRERSWRPAEFFHKKMKQGKVGKPG